MFIYIRCIGSEVSKFGIPFRLAIRFSIVALTVFSLQACISLPQDCNSSEPHAGLVVFGDSYSDSGNLVVDLPTPPFAGSRISNGPLTVEYLADHLGTSAKPSLHPLGCEAGYNYAVVGGNIRGSSDEDLLRQVDAYLDRVDENADPNALYFIMMGGNDVRQLQVELEDIAAKQEIENILDTLFEQAMRLVDAGVMRLMIANNGDMGRLPGSIVDNKQLRLSQYSDWYNQSFTTRMGEFEATSLVVNPNIKVAPFDLFTAMDEILLNHQVLGFVNATDACFDAEEPIQPSNLFYKAECKPPPNSNINKFVFFDSVHATTKTHSLISEQIILALPAVEP